MDDLLPHLHGVRRIVIADGPGAPWHVVENIVATATAHDLNLEIFVGWCLGTALAEVSPREGVTFRSFMGGNGVRHMSSDDHFSYVPVRYSQLPKALDSWLRPDLLVVAGVPESNGWTLGTESGWIPSALESAKKVLLALNPQLPTTTTSHPYEYTDVVVIDETPSLPDTFPASEVDDISRAIAENVAALISEDAAVQFGPGPVGVALFQALERRVRVRSGIVNDAVFEAKARGIIAGTPVGAYAVGSTEFYESIRGAGWVDRVEVTHDLASLSQDTFFAVNTALEIDMTGQTNVEYVNGKVVAGLGGHSDFAVAASSSRLGASIVALPSRRGSKSTLLERLSEPTTTQRSDVEIVVNEHGSVDLRGLSDIEKRSSLSRLWDH
jgi:acyl-CoA hydrolase